jgi:hypothetical protein
VQAQSATGEVDGDVVLDGGAPDLVMARAIAALAEKAVAGLARADVALVDKAASELEKVVVGRRHGRERGRRTTGRHDREGERRAAALGHSRDTARQALTAVENAVAVRRSTSAQVAVIFLENEDNIKL